MKRLSLLLAACCCCLAAMTADFEVNGIAYNITSSAEPYTVKVTSSTAEYIGDIVIPASVTYAGTTYSVTTIGDKAFRNCNNLISITLPNSITIIDRLAFEGCGNLTSITIPESVTYFSYGVFTGCIGLTSVRWNAESCTVNITYDKYGLFMILVLTLLNLLLEIRYQVFLITYVMG